jgi:hypothetical protein
MGGAMTEKDFVMAWLLAARAGSDAISFTDTRVSHNINQALAIYEKLEDLNDTDNGVSDL